MGERLTFIIAFKDAFNFRQLRICACFTLAVSKYVLVSGPAEAVAH